MDKKGSILLSDLNELKNVFTGHCRELKCSEEYIKTCENKFDNIKDALTALHLIRKKQIVVRGLIESFDRSNGIDAYNINFTPSLTNEEYEFLRRTISWVC